MTALALFTVSVARVDCLAQGKLTITFDGPPLPPSSIHSFDITRYSESGMSFTPSFTGGSGFAHAGADLSADYPYDGTPYLQGYGHSGYSTVMCSFSNGSSFGVSSIDIAGFGGGYPDFAVDFLGSYQNGDFIKTQFTGTGIDFQTYHFAPEWSSGLKAFIISIPLTSPDGWSADNLVVIVPEPATGALLLVGAVMVWFSYRRKQKT